MRCCGRCHQCTEICGSGSEDILPFPRCGCVGLAGRLPSSSCVRPLSMFCLSEAKRLCLLPSVLPVASVPAELPLALPSSLTPLSLLSLLSLPLDRRLLGHGGGGGAGAGQAQITPGKKTLAGIASATFFVSGPLYQSSIVSYQPPAYNNSLRLWAPASKSTLPVPLSSQRFSITCVGSSAGIGVGGVASVLWPSIHNAVEACMCWCTSNSYSPAEAMLKLVSQTMTLRSSACKGRLISCTLVSAVLCQLIIFGGIAQGFSGTEGSWYVFIHTTGGSVVVVVVVEVVDVDVIGVGLGE